MIPHQAYANNGLASLFASKIDENYFEAMDLYKRGQYTRALRKVNRFLDDYPGNEDGILLKAWALMKMDELDEAKPLLDTLLAQNPESPELQIALGSYYRKSGEAQKSLEHYQKVLDLNPDDPHALNSILTVALASGEVEKAVFFGKRAYQLDPQNPIINANLAIAYHYAEDFVNRDIHRKNARDLKYHDMKKLSDIFSGRVSAIPQTESAKISAQ